MERIAVLTGEPPLGEGSKGIPKGQWSRHPDGYYVRYMPQGYSYTVIQVWMPGGRAAVNAGLRTRTSTWRCIRDEFRSLPAARGRGAGIQARGYCSARQYGKAAASSDAAAIWKRGNSAAEDRGLQKV